MTISFEIPRDIEEQVRSDGSDPSREAREVFLMDQYRRAKITHRQLEEALGLGFQETEERLKGRGLGQDLAVEEFGAGRDILRGARPR
jgi:hypothetical protein